MKCQHNIYKGKDPLIECICQELETGKKHMIFTTGKMGINNICPKKHGRIKTESRNGKYIIIKERIKEC